MKKKKWLIIIGIAIVAIVLLIVIVKKLIIRGESGGLIYGRSHEEGGLKGYIKDSGELIEVEKGEAILNKQTMAIKDEYKCEGTPAGIASKLNEIGGGVKFADNGECIIK